MNLILKAAALAREAHSGQRRKYNDLPYVVHPARVAGRVAIHPDATEDMVAAAFLHDVVEDTTVLIETIRRETNPEVAGFVRWMTNPSKGLKILRAERKKMDREHLARAPWQVKIIKLIDRIDNLTEMTGAPEDFARLYADESFRLVEAIGEADTGLKAELIERALALLPKGAR